MSRACCCSTTTVSSNDSSTSSATATDGGGPQRGVGVGVLVSPAQHMGRSMDTRWQLAPQYDLAWREFQAKLTTEFIAWQADIVREYARTTNS